MKSNALGPDRFRVPNETSMLTGVKYASMRTPDRKPDSMGQSNTMLAPARAILHDGKPQSNTMCNVMSLSEMCF
jgi:hypothetical protein